MSGSTKISLIPELISLHLPHLVQCAKVAGFFCPVCTVTFAAAFLNKKSAIHDLLQHRDLEITYQNKVVYKLHNCCVCIADRGEQQDTSQWKQSSLIRSAVERVRVCVTQQILSAGTMKSFYFLFSLRGFCCLIHMSLSAKTSWPGGSMYRFYTHSTENVCVRGTGCGEHERVCINPTTAGHLPKASKGSRRHGAIKSISQSSLFSST